MALFGWERVGRNNSDYKACLAATTATGAIVGGATGSVVPVAGTVAGYAGGALWGLAAGYLACPYLVPAIKNKIEKGMHLTDSETRSAAEAMGTYVGIRDASEAVKLVALVKTTRNRKMNVPACTSANSVAKQLLRKA